MRCRPIDSQSEAIILDHIIELVHLRTGRYNAVIIESRLLRLLTKPLLVMPCAELRPFLLFKDYVLTTKF